MKNSKKEADTVLFMDDLEGTLYKHPHMASFLFLNTVALLVVMFFIWASFATVDEIARGTGQVVPSQHSQIIQSLEGGILEELLIKEGDLVKKDQIIMRLNNVASDSEKKGLTTKILSMKLRKVRLEAEARNQNFKIDVALSSQMPKIAENEQKLFESRRKEFQNAVDMIDKKAESFHAQIEEVKSQMARDGQNIALIQKELAITSKMVAQKALPQIDELRLKRQLNDANGSLKAAKDKQKSLEADLSSVMKQREDQADKFKSQALGELNEVETEISALEEKLRPMGERLERAEIRSPVEGLVNNIAIRTVGGVIEPAMKLVEIVPVGDELSIQARVMPSDIAFLKLEQEARVKLTAYESSRYGYLQGKVSRIGASSISDQDGKVYFEIEIKTDKIYLGTRDRPLPITSGMVAEVNIITGKKSILEYLMKPFLRIRDRAFTER